MKEQLRSVERVFLITLFITFLICPVLYAVDKTLPAPEEIIAKNIEAIGGTKALKKIKNRKIVESIKIHSMNMDMIKVTTYQERPDKYLNVEDMLGSNGEIAWDIGPVGIHIFEGHELSWILREHLFDGPDGPDAHYTSMKTEGVELIKGKDCYKVVKTQEKGQERIVYYDKKSFLIVKIINGTRIKFINDPGEGNLLEYYIEEYQKIDNILFPYKIVRMVKGKSIAEAIFETVEHNIEIPEGIFDIPKEVKTIISKNETERCAQQ